MSINTTLGIDCVAAICWDADTMGATVRSLWPGEETITLPTTNDKSDYQIRGNELDVYY